jgi:hypothetical protein
VLHPKVTEALLPLQQRARLTNEGNIAVQSHLARAEGIRQRHPRWNEAPRYQRERTNGFLWMLANDGDMLGGSYVVAEVPVIFP